MYEPIRRISIIEDDDVIMVDDYLVEIDCSSIKEEIWAIQWDVKTQKGEIEFNDSTIPNKFIDSLEPYKDLVNAALEKLTAKLTN